MSVQDNQMLPSMISRAQNSARRKAPSELPAALDLVASAGLTLTLVPVLLYFGMSMAMALPTAVLMGLTSQSLFRLVFRPASNDVFSPTTLVPIYFVSYFVVRSFYLSTAPFFSRVGRNPYDDYIPVAMWCACAGYVSYLSGSECGIARTFLRRFPAGSEVWPKSIPTLRVLTMMVLGFASLIYLFKHGLAVGNYGNKDFQRNPPPGEIILLQSLIDLTWVAICVFLVTTKQKADRTSAWLLLGFSIGLLCIKLAVSGGKVALIQPLLEAGIVYHYGKRRFRIWEMLIVGIPVILLAFGVVNFYRFVVVGRHGSPKSVADLVSRVSSTSDLLSSGGGMEDRQSALEQMAGRDAGVDSLALIMKLHTASLRVPIWLPLA